jgi:3,4-dihydroxy 2-butanone 4-phosphate synthase/GTP cyclohydrolase II
MDSVPVQGTESDCVALFAVKEKAMQSIPESTSTSPVIPSLDSVEEVIAAVGRGEMVVVVDDEHRENEGDLICAADAVTPEIVNFMASKGRGLICVTMPGADLARLGIADMRHAGDEEVPVRTAFMESVDARDGITTGISAEDRARTVSVMANPDSGAADLVRPGHVFPIKAHPRGVLGRAGHTEASVDLARMSGRRPAGLICEIMLEDGSMARLEDLLGFAGRHGLRMCSVAALIEYRQRREGEVVSEGEIALPTRYGEFQCRIYRSSLDDKEHLALVVGDVSGDAPPLVRVHSECLTGDVLHSMRCDCGDQLSSCMRQVQEEGRGVILYMRQEGRGIGLGAKLRAYALQDQGLDTVEANLKLGFGADQREYRSSALILKDLGIDSVRLMTNNPLKVDGLEQNGIRVSERIPVVIPSNPHNAKYLETKRTRLGHLL